MLEEDLVAYLSSKPTVVAFVGDRVWPLLLPPEPALPALVYQRISAVREESHAGDGLVHPRIQIRCWANTYSEAKRLAEAVRLSLRGYKGQMGATRVEKAKLANEIDDRQELTERESVIQDWIIWHEEA